MPVRKTILADGEVYHIYNRCVGGEEPFASNVLLNRACDLFVYYKYETKMSYSRFRSLAKEEKQEFVKSREESMKMVDIYSYSIMPNHFHLLVKQLKNEGVKRFVANFQNSFAKYFNLKTDRHGSLFQNTFKAKRVETDEQLLHVSRYIHLNPVTSYLIELDQLKTSPLTSYRDYILGDDSLVESSFVTDLVGGIDKYKEFVANQMDYQRELASIKNLIIEKH